MAVIWASARGPSAGTSTGGLTVSAVFDRDSCPDRRRGASELLRDVGVPALERLGPSVHPGMQLATARRDFVTTGDAMIELALDGREPSDRALGEAGAPPSDTLRRFLSKTDLGNLPSLSAQLLVESGVAQPPRHIAVEARTEAIAGPEKFGVHHPCRPKGVGEGVPPPNAANSPGGIAHAFAFSADTERPSMLLGDAVVVQGFWNPHNWGPRANRRQIEEELRQRTGDPAASFTTDASSIAKKLIQRMQAGEEIAGAGFALQDAVVVGGHLHVGDPLVEARELDGVVSFGESTDDVFIGESLDAHADFQEAGIPVLLTMSSPVRDTGQGEPGWSLLVGEDHCTLRELVRPTARTDERWTELPERVVADLDPAAQSYLWLGAIASDSTRALDVWLLMRIGSEGELDIWSTTADLSNPVERDRMVRAAASEMARRSPSSPAERALRGLLLRGWAQRHKRRRRIERRNFSALAQAVRSFIELAPG